MQAWTEIARLVFAAIFSLGSLVAFSSAASAMSRSTSYSSTTCGRTATSLYNGSAGTLTQTSPMGRIVVAHLDDRDRMTQVDVPGVAESARTFYDSLGRIERVEQGTGAAQRTVTYAYSPTSGYLESITDPLNRIVRFERDEAGRVTTQILPDLREIGISYDGNGNVTSVTPPTRPAHDFDYTLFDQLETYTPPEAGFTPRATTYAYNLDGQVTAITRPDGQQIVPTYEASGRLDYVTIPGGTIDTGYDTAGRVSAISAPGGVSQSFTYAGPLVTSMTTAGPVPGSVGFVYNNDFALTSRTVNGGNAVAFAYDDDGLLTQAGALVLVAQRGERLPRDDDARHDLGQPDAHELRGARRLQRRSRTARRSTTSTSTGTGRAGSPRRRRRSKA